MKENKAVEETMVAYEIIDYELLPDGMGGKSVNDSWKSGEVEIPQSVIDGDDRQLIRFLKSEGIIKRQTRYTSIEIEGEPNYTLYFNHRGDPSFELRRKTD